MDYQVKNIYGKIKNRSVAVRVPGSKSITARALLLAALADGESVLYNAQLSDDCATFLKAVKSLGISAETDGSTVKIKASCPYRAAKFTLEARALRQGF